MGVSLEQTSQTISGISFITAYVAYASTNENQTHLIETELFFFLTQADHFMFTCVLRRCAVFHNLISAETFRRVLAASGDSCAEIKSAPSVA